MNELVIKSWPKLYKTSSKEKELEWQISVQTHPSENETDIQTFDIVTTHGQVGGQLQESRVHIKQGKNQGRTNATSAKQQAISEAESKWKKQLDKSYSEDRGGAEKTYKPMLAKTYEDCIKKVVFPSYVQPKLDGHRCIAVKTADGVELLTRNSKPYIGLGHIRSELDNAMRIGEIWDGEIYHHEMTFQQLTSYIKKPQAGSDQLQYHIYDVVSDETFLTRIHPVNSVITGLQYLRAVKTITVHSHEETKKAHSEFVNDGYEGAMLRVGHCNYRQGARSAELLKLKSWMDAEFKIIGVTNGIGKDEKHGIFICETKEGAEFNVRCEGESSILQEYLLNQSNYIGKQLTVKFFEWTTSSPSVPRFPVGLQIREDL